MSSEQTPTALSGTSIQRLSQYPLVKSVLDSAYSLSQKTYITRSAYSTAEGVTKYVLGVVPAKVKPVFSTADAYANMALNYIESYFPIVKSDSSEIYNTIRKPADGVVNAASDAYSSALSRITSIQKNIQDISPKAATADTLKHILAQLDSLKEYTLSQVDKVPQLKPVHEKLTSLYEDFKVEVDKDVPVRQKAANIGGLAQKYISPIVALLQKELAKRGKIVNDGINSIYNGAKETGKEGLDQVQSKVNGVAKGVQDVVDDVVAEVSDDTH